MMGSSKLTSYVLAPLLIGCICWTSSVSGQGCTQTELNTIRSCISAYTYSLISYFGTGGTCNQTLMTQDVCNNYGGIVTCVNSAGLSSTTCRPYMVSQMDAELGISCKVNDFVVTCTNAPQLNQGSINQGCNLAELTTIRQCISPYSNQFISSFGTGATCTRALITQQVCSYYGTIVTCVNSAGLSSTTCRPYMVSQIDAELVISCKVNDFVVTCTNAPKIYEGSINLGCNLAELTTIRHCISPYSNQFLSSFGTGETCTRALITQQVCSSFSTIVTCVNNAGLSSTTCRPYMVSQMDVELDISCKVNDFVVTCTSAPKIYEGTASGTTSGTKSGASFLSNAGAHTIFVAIVTHVILTVFAFAVRNS